MRIKTLFHNKKYFLSFILIFIICSLFIFNNNVKAEDFNDVKNSDIECVEDNENVEITYDENGNITKIIPQYTEEELENDKEISFSEETFSSKAKTLFKKSNFLFSTKNVGTNAYNLNQMGLSLGCSISQSNDNVTVTVKNVKGCYVIIRVYKDGNYWTSRQIGDSNNCASNNEYFSTSFGNAGAGTYSATAQYYYPSCFRFIYNCYQNFFDRNPDWEGFYSWYEVINGRDGNANLQYWDYVNLDDSTAAYYRDDYGNNPTNLTSRIISKRAQRILCGFANSPEFRNRYSAINDSNGGSCPRHDNHWDANQWKSITRNLYRGILSRSYGNDSDGQDYWDNCAWRLNKVYSHWRYDPSRGNYLMNHKVNNGFNTLAYLTYNLVSSQECTNDMNNGNIGLSNGYWNGQWLSDVTVSSGNVYVGHNARITANIEDENGNISYWYTVINGNYVYGNTISWSRAQDDAWQALSYYNTMYNSNITGTITLMRRRYWQTVNVRYENENGGWSNYSAVINTNYRYGQWCAWSRGADSRYQAASTGYTVYGANTKYVDVYRQRYKQVVYVRYQNVDGSWGDYSPVINSDYRYEQNVSWSRPADEYYQAASISYTTYGANTKYVDVYRKTFTVDLSKDEHINSISGGGTYYSGASVTIKAIPNTGYDFINWTGSSSITQDSYTFTVLGNKTWKANSKAKVFSLKFNDDNADAGKNIADTVRSVNISYDSALPTVTIPKKEFTVTYKTSFGEVAPKTKTVSYTFKGYYTGKNGQGTKLYDEAGKPLVSTWTYLENKNLYAYWDSSSAKITLPSPGDIEDSVYKVVFKNTETDNGSDVSIDAIGTDTNFNTEKTINGVQYKKNGNSVVATVTQTLEGWKSSKTGEAEITAVTYTPTQSVTLTADLKDDGLNLLKISKENHNFIGWLTKEQNLSTLINNKYIGGGDSVNQNESTYQYTGGGTDYNYGNKIKMDLNLATKENGYFTVTLYPWYNEFPTETNTLTGAEIFVNPDTGEQYDVIAYEGQNITDTQLLALVNVKDYEDDYLQAVNELNVTDERIRQVNAENMKLKIKSIQYLQDSDYSETKTTYTEDTPTKLDTKTNNIGNFIITYEVTDDGISQITDRDSKITLTFTKRGYILYNNNPYIETSNRYLSSHADIESMTKEELTEYLLKGQTACDIEDSMVFLPWWIDKTYNDLTDSEKLIYNTYNSVQTIKDNVPTKTNTYKYLSDSREIVSVYNLIFDAEYTLDNLDKVINYQNSIDTLDKLYALKTGSEEDKEAWNNLTNFSVLITVTDQFGKQNKINENMSFYKYKTDGSIEENSNYLYNYGQPVIITFNIDKYTSYESNIRYISKDASSGIASDSMWNENNYYSDLLNETFNKKDNPLSISNTIEGIINDDVNITINNY